MKVLTSLLILISFICIANDPLYTKGYAIIKGEKIFGQIHINAEGGSITVKQDGINRMYLVGIEKVVLLNATKDEYIVKEEEGKLTFFKLLVDGSVQLLEKNSELVAAKGEEMIILDDEKSLYQALKEEKKDIKDYVFVRNISTEERSGMVEIFQYYNNSFAGDL